MHLQMLYARILEVSTHASAREATSLLPAQGHGLHPFLPTPPRGRRLLIPASAVRELMFLPTPPRGRRPEYA